jgi:tetratricopeptide (TPR) repeat protein
VENVRKGFAVIIFLVFVLWGEPFRPASADGGGMSLLEEIGARISHINGLPAGERLGMKGAEETKGSPEGQKQSPQEEFFASLELEKVVLGEDGLREIDEYREAMKNAGLGAEQIEEAVKGFELAKKMSALGPAVIMQAGSTAAKKQDSKTETRETAAIGDAPLPPAAEGYSGSDEQEKARWALGLADSMAVATFYDIADAGMIRAAGLAVSAYPHPLLLNNYAGMIGEVSPDDALFFYFSALALEPRNPVILTNIAMSFLDREDFGAARNYAAQALSENPEFGPAFQVLTICHLRDGNSVLAAETLMKSARDCFDDLSVRLFDDYLEEVGNLDVTQGEKYPLQEDQLEILYQIAKKYGDPERENGADTPGAQIRINPFPVFGSADHYLNSGDFLLGDAERRTAKLKKISAELSRLEKAVFGRQGSRGALPVVKNMRQYYAYLVLESYYYFKMRELNWKLQEEDPTDDLLEDYVDAYMAQCMPFRKQEDDFHHAFLKQPKGTPKEEAEWYRKGIRFYSACLDHQKILLDITRRYTLEYLKIPKSKYDERRPLVEEFWLKAGGLMKYMTDRDAYDLTDNRREMFAVDWMDIWPTAGYPVPNAGDSVFVRAVDEAPLGMSSPFCSISPPALQGALERMQRYQEELAKLSKGLNKLTPPPKILPKYAFDVDPVEIERTAIPLFKEAGDLPLIGFEGTLPFSDKHTAYTDGGKSTWVITGEGGARGSVYDDTSGSMTTFSAASKPAGSASVFDVGAKLTDLQELGDRLDKATEFVREKVFRQKGGKESEGSGPFGAPFQGADMMKKGQEAIGFLQAAGNVRGAGSKMYGEYVTRDRDHRVIDHGLVYIRQVGGALPIENSPELGREVLVMKSRITGVSTKQEFTQYKFKFATVRTR